MTAFSVIPMPLFPVIPRHLFPVIPSYILPVIPRHEVPRNLLTREKHPFHDDKRRRAITVAAT